MPLTPQIENALTHARDGSRFKERIFAFASLPMEFQRKVLDSGPTIAHGADAVLQMGGIPLDRERKVPARFAA